MGKPLWNGLDGVSALDAACGNCGRTKRLRLNRYMIDGYKQRGVHTVEDLGEKLSCARCREHGKPSKNISLTACLVDGMGGSDRRSV
jgi:hypothetical protein